MGRAATAQAVTARVVKELAVALGRVPAMAQVVARDRVPAMAGFAKGQVLTE